MTNQPHEASEAVVEQRHRDFWLQIQGLIDWGDGDADDDAILAAIAAFEATLRPAIEAEIVERCAEISLAYSLPGNPPVHAELVSSLTKTSIAHTIRQQTGSPDA